MTKRILICLLALLIPVIAQEAKILFIAKSDAQRLSAAYNAFQGAKKHWEDTREQVAHKYTTKSDGSGKPLPGWDGEVEFSPDFRALVPRQVVFSSGTIWSSYPCATTIPLSGTSGATWPYENNVGSAGEITIKGGK